MFVMVWILLSCASATAMDLAGDIFGGTDGYERTSSVARRAIIGTDDRFRILRPEKTLAGPVGYLLSFFQDGDIKQCSGALVGADLVITAGHCLQDGKRQPVSVLFVPAAGPGYFLPSLPFGWSFAQGWIGWLLGASAADGEEIDLGFVRLREPLGDQAGILAVFPVDTTNLLFTDGWILAVALGYPSDLLFSSGYHHLVMSASFGYLRGWSFHFPGLIEADMDVREGSSGGPVVVQLTDGTLAVIGVISAAAGADNAFMGFGYGFFQAVNFVAPVVEELYDAALERLY
jgi:hypothetical protein